MKAKTKPRTTNSQISKSDVSYRVVLNSTTRKESAKLNAKDISKSVKSEMKILKKFSFC